MTVVVSKADPRRLQGRAFVTLKPVKMFLDDDMWDRVFGPCINLDGGVELQVRDAELQEILEGFDSDTDVLPDQAWIPVLVVDIYLPRVMGVVRWSDLRDACNPVSRGDGVRATGRTQSCATKCRTCAPCFRDWWRERARQVGVSEWTVSLR